MPESQLYTLKRSPDGGHGLFARVAIKTGTRIIQEQPVLMLSKEEVQTQSEEKWVITKMGHLTVEAQNEIMELYHNPKKLQDFKSYHNQKCPGTDWDAGLVLAKFYTNAASISGGLKVGLFTTFCRMNHSCVPNTCWVYDEVTGMEVYAVRDITEGEEITDSYTEVACSRESRAKELANWGFRCACTACEGPEAEVIDIRRRRVAQIRELLELYSRKDEKPVFSEVPKTDLEALKLAEESVSLLSLENLVEELGAAHGWCAKFARRAGLRDVKDFHEDKEYQILVLTTGDIE
ncbi:unnamed protein product [Clonostachys chloroleuca]|uniref:SET domain-containing protein n=1 Tax=Clonostachys chloroleuca TaxID=1926264 RepID=A0AA35LXA3_9HYPO|nr:unnamed protein product [Clonostachys chloroleuca]